MDKRSSEWATGNQLHTIAILCSKLRIKESLEERKMTMGEAGRLIRKLKGGLNER